MPVPYGYSDLTAFWECPRRWAYSQQFRPVKLDGALLRGAFTHKMLAAFWARINPYDTLLEATAEERRGLEILGPDGYQAQVGVIEKAAREAREMFGRYQAFIAQQADHFNPLTIEKTITTKVAGVTVGGTPDMIGVQSFLTGQHLAVVEWKTSGNPSIESLNHTGQVDYYSYLLRQRTEGQYTASFILIDIITPDLVTRVMRPPRFDRGEYLAQQLVRLQDITQEVALEHPRPSWRCARCPFLRPCQLREDGADDQEYLLQYYFGTDKGEGNLGEADGDQ